MSVIQVTVRKCEMQGHSWNKDTGEGWSGCKDDVQYSLSLDVSCGEWSSEWCCNTPTLRENSECMCLNLDRILYFLLC